MRSCSPRQNFAVPVYKNEYLSFIFVDRKKVDFYIHVVLYCGTALDFYIVLYCGTALHTLLLC